MASTKNEKSKEKPENMSRYAKKIYNLLKKYPDYNKLIKGIPRFPHQDSSLKSLVDILKTTDDDMIYSILKNTSFFPDEYDLLKKEIIEKNDKIREIYSNEFHTLNETEETDKNPSETKKNKLYEDEVYNMLNLYNKVLKYSTGNYREKIKPIKAANEIGLLNSTLDELNNNKELDKGFLESIDGFIVPEHKGFEDYYTGFLRTVNEDITQIKDKYENSNEITKKFFETLKKYSGDDELIIGTAVSRALKKGKDKDDSKKTLEVLLNVLNKESVLKARASFGGLEWRNKLKQRFEEAEKNDLASSDVGHSLNDLFNNIGKYLKFDDDRKTNKLKNEYIPGFKEVLKEMGGSKETETVKKFKPTDEELHNDYDRKSYVKYLADIIVNMSSVSKPSDLDSEIDSLTESALKYRGEKLEKFLKTMDRASDFGYGVGVFSNNAMTKKGKDFDIYLDDVVNFLEQLKGSVDKPILSEKEINDIIEGFNKNKGEKKRYFKALKAAEDDPETFKKVARAPLNGIFGNEFKREVYNKVKKNEDVEYSILPKIEDYEGLEEYVDPHFKKIVEFAREFENPRMRDSYIDSMKGIIKNRTNSLLDSILTKEEIRSFYFQCISDLNDTFKLFKKEGASEKQIAHAARSFDNAMFRENKNIGEFEGMDYIFGLNKIVIPAMKSLKNYFGNPRELWNADGIENLIGTYLKTTTEICKTPGTNVSTNRTEALKSLFSKAEKMPAKDYLDYLKKLEKMYRYSPSDNYLTKLDSEINSMLNDGEYNKINSYMRKAIREVKREKN